jgi:hypothetical protein
VIILAEPRSELLRLMAEALPGLRHHQQKCALLRSVPLLSLADTLLGIFLVVRSVRHHAYLTQSEHEADAPDDHQYYKRQIGTDRLPNSNLATDIPNPMAARSGRSSCGPIQAQWAPARRQTWAAAQPETRVLARQQTPAGGR